MRELEVVGLSVLRSARTGGDGDAITDAIMNLKCTSFAISVYENAESNTITKHLPDFHYRTIF